ncbi:MAG: acyl carrier protein [Chthonomonadaceae bacterium]|nr:acyl carrier protein [Chthonomonadaceae bacterium]
MRNTFDRVRSIVAQRLDIREEQVTPAVSLKDDLAADSLDLVEITMALEEEFEMEFGDEAMTLTTVEQIVDYIQGKLEAQP